ncbi:MAG: hypothetical protein ABI912_01840 [Actinomycetota bacterium]
MRTRQRALRYLRHPVVVVSIVLLALNDAVWKGAAPPWLTGKLSDFAGLVFFPGLLALVFGLLLPRMSSRYAGLVAWWSTAVVFAAVKTLPVANHAIVSVLGVLGGPMEVVRDPSDVLALAVLPVGWWLWNRASAPSLATGRTIRSAAGWIVATCAVLATGATSCPASPVVHGVIANDGRLYAATTWSRAVSADEGVTWSYLEQGAPAVPGLPTQHDPAGTFPPGGYPADDPASTTFGTTGPICHPTRTQVCYRIVDSTHIAGSVDSGQTWRVVWSEPAADIEHRASRGCGSGPRADAGARSMVFASSTEPVVIVAMGSEGILRHAWDGDWQRVSVLGARLRPDRKPWWQEFDGFDFTVLLAVVLLMGIAAGCLMVVLARRRRRLVAGPWGYGGPEQSGYDPTNPYASHVPPPPPWPHQPPDWRR